MTPNREKGWPSDPLSFCPGDVLNGRSTFYSSNSCPILPKTYKFSSIPYTKPLASPKFLLQEDKVPFSIVLDKLEEPTDESQFISPEQTKSSHFDTSRLSRVSDDIAKR